MIRLENIGKQNGRQIVFIEASAALQKGDTILLCSDGFWAPLTQRQLLHALLTRSLEDAIPELTDLAEERAGEGCDNVTVLAMTYG